MDCVPSPVGVAVVSQSYVHVPGAPVPPVGAAVAVPSQMPLHNKGVVVMFNAKGSGLARLTEFDASQPFSSVTVYELSPPHNSFAGFVVSPLLHRIVVSPVPPVIINKAVPSQLSGQVGSDVGPTTAVNANGAFTIILS